MGSEPTRRCYLDETLANVGESLTCRILIVPVLCRGEGLSGRGGLGCGGELSFAARLPSGNIAAKTLPLMQVSRRPMAEDNVSLQMLPDDTSKIVFRLLSIETIARYLM